MCYPARAYAPQMAQKTNSNASLDKKIHDAFQKLIADGEPVTNEKVRKMIGGGVIPPFLMGSSRRIQAAVFSFIAGVMPPIPMLGRSLL